MRTRLPLLLPCALTLLLTLATAGSLHASAPPNMATLLAERDSRTNQALQSQGSILDKDNTCTVDFDPRCPIILVNVKIGTGQTSYRFLFDTGSDGVVISKPLARALHLAVSPFSFKSTDAVGAKGSFRLCRSLDSITLGCCRVQHPFCVVGDLQSFEEETGIHIDGMLGVSFLSHYRVTIDYPQHQITFSQSAEPLRDPYLFHAVDAQSLASLAIPVIVDGRLLRLIPDTGSAITALADTLLRKLATPQQATVRSLGSMSAGVNGQSPRSAQTVRIKDLQLGDYRLHDFPVGNLADGIDGLLGADFLSQFRVTFDYPNNMVALTPLPSADFAHNMLTYGLCTISHQHQAPRITGVWEHSPAANAGLQAGDRILKINDKAATQLDCAEMDENANAATPTTVTLLVTSHGKQRRVTLTQAELFPPITPALMRQESQASR